MQLHEAIYRGCGNEVLATQIRGVRARLAMHDRDVFGDMGRIAESAKEHGAVVQAILDADPGGAERAMTDHIAGGGRAYADLVLGTGAEPSEKRGRSRR